MNHILSDKLIGIMVTHGIIEPDKAELYAFGLHDIIMILLTMIPVISISYLIGATWVAILYVAFFFPLRIYGGGAHASTEGRCYIASILQILAAVLLIKYLPWSYQLGIPLLAIALIIIILMAPSEHKNRPLSAAEFKAYKKRLRIFLIAEVAIIVICLALKAYTIAITALMAPVSLAISLLVNLGMTRLAPKCRSTEV